MSAPQCNPTDSDENLDGLQCVLDAAGTTKQALENASIDADVIRGEDDDSLDTLNTSGELNVSQTDAFDVDKKPDASQPDDVSNVQHKLDALPALSDVGDVAQVDELLHVNAKSSVLDALDVPMQQLYDDPSNVQGELDIGAGTQHSQVDTPHVQQDLDLVDAVQHSQKNSFNDRKGLNVSRALSDVVQGTQYAESDRKSNFARAYGITAKKDSPNLISRSDVSKAVLDLVGATQHLQEDPANMESINNLISRLKHLLLQERQTYAFMRQNSESRNKLESLHNLIQYLESQVQRLQKAAHRRGLKYYVANISNKVRGHEVGRIGQSMESELQSWLDQQSVREIANVISKGSQDAQVHAISSFESVVQKGYNSLLQEAVLSAGLVEKLAGLLAPDAASWPVAKEAAFALSALIDFNKDIFLSLVLMAKTVENILNLMVREPDEHVLILVSVMKSMLSAGHTVVVDEIYAHDGVSKIVQLLDHTLQDLQHAAMDCVFELAYYGRIEVVNKLFELEVVKKLALLQQSNPTEGETEGVRCNKPAKQEQADPLDFATSWMLPMSSSRMQDADSTVGNPFANAVTKFALHLSIGTGLRKREKRALKQEFLRQIKEVMEDDAEIANITAEVLWAP